MKYLFLILFAFTCSIVDGQTDANDGYSDKYIKMSYYPHGTLKSRVECDLGLGAADTITFYNPVTFEAITEYSNDSYVFRMNGIALYYHSNGQLSDSGYYEVGKRGAWKSYHQNGKIKSIREYDYSLKSFEDFDTNGTLISSGKYKYKLKMGEWNNYHSNGKPHILGTYSAKPIKSDTMLFFDLVTLEQVTEIVVPEPTQTSKHGLWQYFTPDGKLEKEVTYEYGELIKEKLFNNQ